MPLHHARTSARFPRAIDPSLLPRWASAAGSITVSAGDARLTLDQPVSVRGRPAAILTGAGHAVPLECLSATSITDFIVDLHFAETVAVGDVLSFPERDASLRTTRGEWASTIPMIVVGGAPGQPTLVRATYNPLTGYVRLEYTEPVFASEVPFVEHFQGTTPGDWGFVADRLIDLDMGHPLLASHPVPPLVTTGNYRTSGADTFFLGTVSKRGAVDAEVVMDVDAYAGVPQPLGAIWKASAPDKLRVVWPLKVGYIGPTPNIVVRIGEQYFFDNSDPDVISDFEFLHTLTETSAVEMQENTFVLSAQKFANLDDLTQNAEYTGAVHMPL